jgi:glutamine amidotransferase
MCQLLGMNCNTPTDICFSFAGFRQRGGLTAQHRDGWGIAFFEGRGVRLFLDPQSSVESPVADLVRQFPIHSLNVIAHIRKATQGTIGLENTHPFQRELWGRYWVFAHNGHLRGFEPPPGRRFRAVGTTDSERAFCYLMERLVDRFPERMPNRELLFAALAELALEISGYGEFNFLLSSGEWMIAHCSSRLCYVVREAPFSTAHLSDEDVSVDFSRLTTPSDRVAVIATQALTDDEVWIPIPPGTLMRFEHGRPDDSAHALTRPFVPDAASPSTV